MNTPQFDLGTMLSAPQTAIQQIPCDQLHPYHNHKFELYSGERLEDMVASIKENGVLSPIIVQPIEGGYEILIGHNRWNASKLAGLPTVPAIVKAGLTEDEAEMYVIESNVMQRGFENLRISEQAPVWEVDTDTQTVRHRNPKTGEMERYVFHTDHIRYYLHHIEEKRPDLLQEIVDNGEIYKHLDELDTKVTDAVNRQTELLMQSSRDYQAAVMSGRIDQSGAIGNLLRMQAQRAVYDTMIYLWKDDE